MTFTSAKMTYKERWHCRKGREVKDDQDPYVNSA